MKKIRRKKAQTIIEYFLIFAVVTFAVAAAAVLGTRGQAAAGGAQGKGALQQAFNNFLDKAAKAMKVDGTGGEK